MQIFDSRIRLDEIFHTKPKKRYADTDARAIFSLCARCLRRYSHNFSDTTLKDNLSPKLPKSF